MLRINAITFRINAIVWRISAIVLQINSIFVFMNPMGFRILHRQKRLDVGPIKTQNSMLKYHWKQAFSKSEFESVLFVGNMFVERRLPMVLTICLYRVALQLIAWAETYTLKPN